MIIWDTRICVGSGSGRHNAAGPARWEDAVLSPPDGLGLLPYQKVAGSFAALFEPDRQENSLPHSYSPVFEMRSLLVVSQKIS